MEGYGRLISNSGNVYEGDFVRNMKHGHGTLNFKVSGDSYTGDFEMDKISGKGKYIFSAEQRTYEGEFVEGSPYG